MRGILLFILTLSVAIFGSLTARKIKMPAGGMLGAMILVAALNLASGEAVFPEALRVPVQICSGVMVGIRIKKKDLVSLKKVVLPIALLILFMLLMNVTLGISISKLGNLDITTAMFSSSPGGMTDMALVAEDLGANSAYVTLLQLIRLLTIYAFVPVIAKCLMNKEAKKKQLAADLTPEETSDKAPEVSRKKQALYFLLTMAAAATGGILFYFLGVTAGAMLGAMVFTVLFNIFIGNGCFPPKARLGVQVVTGAFLGMKIDMASVLGIMTLIIPAIVQMAGVLLFTMFSAVVIHKITKLDFCVCLMACTPGGVQEMSILSDDLGADTPKVAVMQSARLISVVAFFPTLLKFLAQIF